MRLWVSSTSSAWRSMSEALPWKPPEGWWTMMRALGREIRGPGSPAISRNEPMEAAKPMQVVATGLLMYCMVS